jgi:hypothetical protein
VNRRSGARARRGETKRATNFDSIGLSPEQPPVQALVVKSTRTESARIAADRPGSRKRAQTPIPSFRTPKMPGSWSIRGPSGPEQLPPRTIPAGERASYEYLRAAGNPPGWIARFYELGVDGVFTDDTKTGVAVREEVCGH